MDLNSDLGEAYGAWSLGDDTALLDIVTSANVACGFHAGDPATMARTVTAAAARGVVIGAQVSYPDLVGFGRRELGVSAQEIHDDVLYQLGALEAMCRAAGTKLAFLRPHGALYHRCAQDHDAAAAAVRAAVEFDARLAVVAPPGSALLAVGAAAGLQTVREGFADRRYNDDGSLVPRGQDGAVLLDSDEVAAQALAIATGAPVHTAQGSALVIEADTICLHGDTPGAVVLARAVRDTLQAHGIQIAPALDTA